MHITPTIEKNSHELKGSSKELFYSNSITNNCFQRVYNKPMSYMIKKKKK